MRRRTGLQPIGTGRLVIPLTQRGISVTGIELSAAMADQLAKKHAGIPVVLGDMATTTLPRHLAPGGRFVIELFVPGVRRLPSGQTAVPFHVGEHHVGVDTYDLSTQQGTSHHYWRDEDGAITYGASNFRYVWPSECDLMAQLADLELERRVAGWDGSPFTSDSESHVSIWRKPV